MTINKSILDESVSFKKEGYFVLAVSGSTSLDDYHKIAGCLQKTILNIVQHTSITKQKIILLSGGAKGVDSIAKKFAQENNINFVEIKANWKRYRKGAGPIRNQKIIDSANALIAFKKPTSTGTTDTIRKAIAIGMPTMILYYNSDGEFVEQSMTFERFAEIINNRFASD